MNGSGRPITHTMVATGREVDGMREFRCPHDGCGAHWLLRVPPTGQLSEFRRVIARAADFTVRHVLSVGPIAMGGVDVSQPPTVTDAEREWLAGLGIEWVGSPAGDRRG